MTDQKPTEIGDAIRKLYDTDPDRDAYEGIALQVDGLWEYAKRHKEIAENTAISVYPVGFMVTLLSLRAAILHRPAVFVWRFHLRTFRQMWRNRNYWNGFLAEVDYPPAGLTHTMCGRGWTRRAAARSLGLRLWKDNQR